MLRVALVGIGDAGAHHARALMDLARENTEKNSAIVWTAMVARDVARASAFRAERSAPEGVATFTSYESLLESGSCDAVILATPDGIHAAQVEAAATCGLHILCEKPFALTREDGERALVAARKSNVHVAVGYHLRHHAAHRLAFSRMSELVGNLRSIFIRWAWPDPVTDGWRAKGYGARFWSLAALGTHAIDLAFMFGGSNVARVAVVCEPMMGVDRAAEVSFALADTGGPAGESTILAHVSVAVTHRATSRVLLTGDAGEIEAVGTLSARGDGELFAQASRRGALRETLPFTPHDPYAAQLRVFAEQIANQPKFTGDPAILANLDVLDRVDSIHRRTEKETR